MPGVRPYREGLGSHGHRPLAWPIRARPQANEVIMARKKRKYSRSASEDVERVMRKRKKGTLRSGRSKKKVKSRKQAIAIGLSEARRKGKKVPKRRKRK